MGVKVLSALGSVIGPVGVGPARLFAQQFTKRPPKQVAIERMRNLASSASSKSPDEEELKIPFKLDFSSRSGKTLEQRVAQSIHQWLWAEKKSLREVKVYNKENKKTDKEVKEPEKINLFAVREYEDFKYLTIQEKKKMKELLGIFKSEEKCLVFKVSNRIFESKFDKDRLNKDLFDKWLHYYSSSTLGISAGDVKDVKCEMEKIFLSALQLVNTGHNKKFEENEKKMFKIVSSKKIIREEYITKCKEILNKFDKMDSDFQEELKSNGIDIKRINKYLECLKEGKKGHKLIKFRFNKKRLSDNDIEKYKKFIDENYDKIKKIKKEQKSLRADVGIDPSNGDSKGDSALQRIINSMNPISVRSNGEYIKAQIEFEEDSSLKDLEAMFYSKTNRPIVISPTNKKLMQKILTKYPDLAKRLSEKMSEDCKSRVDQCGNKYRNLDKRLMKLKSLADDKLSYLPNSWDAINSLIEKAENLRTEIARKQSTFSPDTTVSTKTEVGDQTPVATVVPEVDPRKVLKDSSVYSTEATSEDISSESSLNISDVDNICDEWIKMKKYRDLCEQWDSCLNRLDSKLKESSVENAFRVTAEEFTTFVKEQAENLKRESYYAVNNLNTGANSAISNVATGVGGGVRTVVDGVTSPVNYVAEGLKGLGKFPDFGSVRTPSFSIEPMFKLSETSRQKQKALSFAGLAHWHSGVPLPEGWGLRPDRSAYQKNIFGF